MLFRMKKNKNNTNETKPLGILGGLSSGLGFAGLHNVCHTLCQGIIISLAIFGITVVGMPLAFLQDYSLFFSIMGLVSASTAIFIFYWTKIRCSMKKNKKDWFWFAFNFFILIASTVGIIGNFI